MDKNHFQGKYEVELKYRLESKSNFLGTLNNIPHEIMLENNIESDSFFDTPNKTLSAQNKSVCIRTMEPSGIKLWIVKGPGEKRCEATNITDDMSARSMLKTMGFELTLKATKIRSIYFIDKYHVTVDSLEGIGDFAEFAIMTDEESMLETYRRELENLANTFGLSDSSLQNKSYKQMFLDQYA